MFFFHVCRFSYTLFMCMQYKGHAALEEAYAVSNSRGDEVMTEWLLDPVKVDILRFTIIDGAHRWYVSSSELDERLASEPTPTPTR